MSNDRPGSSVSRLVQRLRLRRRGALATEHVNPTANTWLWVVRDEPSRVREVGDRGWWTCAPETREGDLALVYRTAPNKDIAYVVRAVSDAFPRDADDGVPSVLPTRCDYVVVARLDPGLTLAQLRSDPALGDWKALQISFVGAAHRIPGRIWQHLLGRLDLRPALLRELIDAVVQDYEFERDIENILFRAPGRFARVGYRGISTVERQKRFRSGRIADLILTMSSGPAVVVELKRGQVKFTALDQLQDYRTSLHHETGGRHQPLGLLVGAGLDPEVEKAIKRLPDVAFVHLEDLGFRRALKSSSPRSPRRPQ
jgi:hypothetical protein